jgi:hypothetical protein
MTIYRRAILRRKPDGCSRISRYAAHTRHLYIPGNHSCDAWPGKTD